MPRHAERRVASEGLDATTEQPVTMIFFNFKRNHQASTDQATTVTAGGQSREFMLCVSFDTPGTAQPRLLPAELCMRAKVPGRHLIEACTTKRAHPEFAKFTCQ